MEGTHRQLGTRLTDGLRGDDADGFADVNAVSARQITAIALRTDAVARFTGNDRAHHNAIHARAFQHGDFFFFEQGARIQYDGTVLIDDRLGQYASQHAVTQALDHIAAFNHRLNFKAARRAAVFFVDDYVLRDVHQTTGEVTGVRRFQRGIGQAFARAVGGDEVLQDVQAFAEVRGNRRFDDRAIRLGHQATHPGELTNLCRRTPRAGIRHHVDRVEGFLLDGFAVAVDHVFLAQVVHHRLRQFFVGARPDIDDLVVFFALGEETAGVLVFDFLHFVFRGLQDFRFRRRHDHIDDADGGAGVGRIAIAGVHQLVGEDDGFFLTNLAVALVNQVRNRLFVHRTVNEVKRQAFRQDLRQQRAANGGLNAAEIFDAAFKEVQTHFNFRLQVYFACLIGTLHFLDVRKAHALAFRVDALACHVIEAKDNVLRRHDNRLAV